MGSPSNFFVVAINDTQGLAGSSPTIPQTDAALSPKLLDILQYREPIHRRARSDTTPLNDDRRTIVDNLPERPASTTGHQSTRQPGVGGIMQRLDVPEHGLSVPLIPSPTRSETPDTVETEILWSASPIIRHHENMNRVPEPEESTPNPRESPTIIPRISIQMDDLATSDGSSFTVINSSEYQHSARADSTRTDRKASFGGRNGRGVDEARNADQGAFDWPRDIRRDTSMRKASDASLRRTEQQHWPPGQRTRTNDHDPPASLFPGNRDLPTLSLRPIEQTPSRSSSIKRKGTTLICDDVLWLT